MAVLPVVVGIAERPAEEAVPLQVAADTRRAEDIPPAVDIPARLALPPACSESLVAGQDSRRIFSRS